MLVASAFQLFLPLGNAVKNTKFHSGMFTGPSSLAPLLTMYMQLSSQNLADTEATSCRTSQFKCPSTKRALKGMNDLQPLKLICSYYYSVIVPTIMSLMAAIQYYEEQGGTASVFVNDDGMQIIEPELAEARRQYYRENGIGYTARLPNRKASKKTGGFWPWSKAAVAESAVDDNIPVGSLSPQALSNKIGFERKGKFKKASNMNYGLAFSNRVEDELYRLTELEATRRGIRTEDLTVEDDDELYQQALQNMLDADQCRTCMYLENCMELYKLTSIRGRGQYSNWRIDLNVSHRFDVETCLY